MEPGIHLLSKTTSMAKLKKTAAKPGSSKTAKAKKPASPKKIVKKPAARKPAVKAKRPVAKAAPRASNSTKRVVAKKPSKPIARKSVKKIAPKAKAPKVQKKALKAQGKAPMVRIAPMVQEKKISRKSDAGSKIAVGVVAAAAGAAVITVATRRGAKAPQTAKDRNSIMSNTQNNNNSQNKQNKKEVAPGGGIVQPATRSVPAMRLTANDAEILATAKERYGSKDLEAFRKLLIEQRQEAKEEFDILSQNILDTSGEFEADNQAYSLHTAEQGTDAIEREKTFLHAQRTSDYIKKLDEALERIDRGTYGICVICGGLIEKQRLQAVPITQKHVDCKNRTQAKKLSVEQAVHDFEDPTANTD